MQRENHRKGVDRAKKEQIYTKRNHHNGIISKGPRGLEDELSKKIEPKKGLRRNGGGFTRRGKHMVKA